MGIFVYARYSPSESAFFPKCIFHSLTGLKCPGCGSQRCVHSLLRGDVAAALRYNTFFVANIPLVAILLYGEAMRQRKPAIYHKIYRVPFIWAYLILTIAWWIGRNVFGF
jgi:hypothetical protein